MTGPSEEIQLSDGRILACATSGNLHGRPVFFFHGIPGSRLFRPSGGITGKLGIRLICVDRPGYGRSTFQPGRHILDWPADIEQLADHLGLDRFAVAGHSGGGPYALACAYALPQRVEAATTVSGAGPVETLDTTTGMTLINRFAFRFGPYIPWQLWRILVWWHFHERCADPSKALDAETGRRPFSDEEQIKIPEVRKACLLSEEEAFRQGLRGLAWDARLITRPWGFPLEEIRTPVHLWHGTADNSTSIRMARAIEARIPDCDAHICEGEGHLLLFPHWEEILAQFH